MPKSTTLVKVLTVFFLLFVSVCSPTKPATGSFQLFIFKEGWWDLQLGYEPEPAQMILREADTSDSLFVISIDEIEEYDWELKTITLTEDATTKLIEAIAAQGETSDENLKKFKEMMANASFGNPLELALYTHGFVVKVNGETRYGGIFLDLLSQMAIQYPVIRVTATNGKAMLAILPVHFPFEAIDPKKVLGDFWGVSETATQFRTVIRSDEIMKIFIQAGKLKQ